MFTPPDPSDSQAVAHFMADAIAAVAVALDDGVSQADLFLEKMDLDPHLWSHIVRSRAVQVLKENESQANWTVGRELQNSGIEIVRGPFTMRVFKAQDGGPPHPGGSYSRRRFWTQLDQLALVFDDTTFGGKPANLILDWGVDEDRAVMVALSKPDGLWKYQQRPRVEWRIAVPTGEERMPRFEGTDEDIFLEFDFGEEGEEQGSGSAAEQ